MTSRTELVRANFVRVPELAYRAASYWEFQIIGDGEAGKFSSSVEEEWLRP
jgi:hypothetical protein